MSGAAPTVAIMRGSLPPKGAAVNASWMIEG
jgi:hypothetical protein